MPNKYRNIKKLLDKILTKKIKKIYSQYLVLKTIYKLNKIYKNKYAMSKKILSHHVIKSPIKSMLISGSIGFVLGYFLKKKHASKTD